MPYGHTNHSGKSQKFSFVTFLHAFDGIDRSGIYVRWQRRELAA